MQLDLTEDEKGRRPLVPGDHGFLVRAKIRGMRNVAQESIRRFKAYTQEYMASKPDLNPKESEPEPVKVETEDGDKEEKKKRYPPSVKFRYRELMYDNCVFLTSNLPDPADFVHFAFSKMADTTGWPRPRFPLRVMPIQAVCTLRPRSIEAAIIPLLEKAFGNSEPLRFSLVFHGSRESEEMTQQQVGDVVRNCLWSVNANCVQCIKYQDYAIMLEMIDPLLCIGVAKDYNQLGCYNTMTVRHGRDLSDQKEDSEDEISDDPNLDEEDNMKRKLRIKRKRRAEKAGSTQTSKQAKRSQGDEALDEAQREDEEDAEDEGEEQEPDAEEDDEDEDSNDEEVGEDEKESISNGQKEVS